MVRFCCFIHVKDTIFGGFTFFLLVSSRYLLMTFVSPENQPSIFPPVFIALDFILLADGGVPAMLQRLILLFCREVFLVLYRPGALTKSQSQSQHMVGPLEGLKEGKECQQGDRLGHRPRKASPRKGVA